jgi:Pectate lyase superfamily protein
MTHTALSKSTKRNRTRWRVVGACCAALLALPGCGGEQRSSSSAVDQTTPIPSGSPVQVSATDAGAVGDGIADDGPALQKLLDRLPAGSTVNIPEGKVFAHSDLLIVKSPGTQIVGTGTLLATNEQRSGLWLMADDVVLDGPTIKVANPSKRWSAYEMMAVRVGETRGVSIRHVNVVDSAASGIYIGNGAHDFSLSDVKVIDSRADGIHMTSGVHDGTVTRATVSGSGDDGIAVVSYVDTARGPCHDITVEEPRVLKQKWGRGLTVAGGENVTFRDIALSDSNGAGVYIAAESEWKTTTVKNVLVDGGTITHANYNGDIQHGAVMVYNSQSGTRNEGIVVRNLTITNTLADRHITLLDKNGENVGVILENLTFVGGPELKVKSNLPQDAVKTSNLMTQPS